MTEAFPPTTNPLNSIKPVKTANAVRAELRLIHITRISAFRTSCKKADKAIHASRNDNQAQPPTSPSNNKLPKDNKNKTQKTPIRTGQNMRLTPRRCPSTISLGERPVVSSNSKAPERRSSPIRRQSKRQKRKGLEGKNPNQMHSHPRHSRQSASSKNYANPIQSATAQSLALIPTDMSTAHNGQQLFHVLLSFMLRQIPSSVNFLYQDCHLD